MDALDRTFRHLVRVIEERYPTLISEPFEVADLYQNVLPYRHHRRELGLETNQEYEHVLLQLLSGARDYLIVDDRMRERLGGELASAHPDPGAFREFADTRIALSPMAVRRLSEDSGTAHATETEPFRDEAGDVRADESEPTPIAAAPPPPARTSRGAPRSPAHVSPPPPPPPPSRATAPLGRESGARSTAHRSAAPVAGEPPSAPVARAAASRHSSSSSRGSEANASNAPTAPRGGASVGAPPAASAPRGASQSVSTPPAGSGSTRGANTVVPEAGEDCRYCGQDLPAGRRITFCPHCGQNLTVVNCLACGTELELGWQFCTTCGRPASAP